MVVFSPELFSIQSYGGITRCMIELMRALDALDYDWSVWAGRHGSQSLEQFRKEIRQPQRIMGTCEPQLPGRRHAATTGEWQFRQFLQSGPRRVIHRTQIPAFDLAPRHVAKVATLHDMLTEREGASRKEHVRSWFKRRALEGSDAIVCISDHTRQELLASWPHLESRCTVIHHGVRPVSLTPVPCGEEHPFFLYVGAREYRKNFPMVVKALAASSKLADFNLLCIGGGAFEPDEAAMIAEAGLTGRVIQRYADDATLAGLYAGATALVYPSILEGFGLPLVEAMLYECPAICAPVSCMPEIGGDGVLYAAPHDVEAWVAAMESMAFDSVAASAIRAAGRVRAGHFTWERSAQAHRALYDSLL